MEFPNNISEFVDFFNSESFKSEPSKKKLISKLFGQKEFNHVLVEAVSFLATEFEKEKESQNELLQAFNTTLRAQNAQLVSIGNDLIEEQSTSEKLTRELAFQQNLFSNQYEKIQDLFGELETQVTHQQQKFESALTKEVQKNTNSLGKKISTFQKQGTQHGKDLRSAVRETEKTTTQIGKEIFDLKNSTKGHHKNQEVVDKEIEQISDSLGELSKKQSSRDKKVEKQTEEIKSLKFHVEEFADQANTLNTDLTKITNRLSKSESSIEEANTQLTIVCEDKLSAIESNYSLNEKRLDTLHKNLESSVLGFIALENAFKSETENTHKALTDISGKIEESSNSREKLASLVQKKEKSLHNSIEEISALFKALKSLMRGNLAGKDKASEKSQKEFLSKIDQFSELLSEGVDEQALFTEEEYVAFENKYRGSRELIKKRLEVYKPDIFNALEAFKNEEVFIVDLGCGRGEWLSNLTEWGFKKPMGIDANAAMVEDCKKQGIAATKLDLFEFLKKAPKDKYHMISAFHVLEHLTHKQLNELAAGLMLALKPGGYFLFETPNPGNVIVGASTFHLDPTHKVPLNMELAEFFFKHRGFEISKTYFLNGLDMDFDLGENPKRRSLQAFLKRWVAVGLDYGLLMQKPIE